MKRLILILAVALVLLRVACLGLTDLFPEEAYYWNYAMHLDIGYLDHPPMVAWLIHLGTLVLGDTAVGIRVFAVLSALVTSFFVYRLTAIQFGREVGRTALLLAQLLPFMFMTGFMMTPDAPLVACWAGALYFLARALLEGRTSAWLGLGVCLGVGMLSKYTIVLLGPATLIFITVDAGSRRWWRHPAPYLAVLLAVVIFSPVIIWNAQHHWASFAFQSADRVAEARRFSTHELLGAIIALLTPLGAIVVWQALASRRMLPPEESRRRLFARIYTLTPLAVFLIFSFTHRVKLNWTGPLWLAVLPAFAAAVTEPTSAFIRRAWIATIAVFVLIYATFLQYLSFGLPGAGWAPGIALLPVGWSELGRDIEKQKAAISPPANGRVLVVGFDRNFTAAAAAYYNSDKINAVRDTTGAHLFGRRALMFEYWFPIKDQIGATLLLVSIDRHDLDSRRVRDRTASLAPIEEHWLARGGRRIIPYYTRVATGYRSADRD